MCGIVAVFTRKGPARDRLTEIYQDQYARGQKGFGLIEITPGHKVKVSRATEPVKFIMDLYRTQAPMLVAHHRLPTSTENKMDQTHPILISRKENNRDYYIVHNGIIWNKATLKHTHETEGFRYQTERKEIIGSKTLSDTYNDSECLAIEVVRFLEGQTKEIKAEGSIAFICVEVDHESQEPLKVHFGRNNSTSPLRMGKNKTQLLLASENIGEALPPDVLYSFKINDVNMELTKWKMPFKAYTKFATEKSNIKKSAVKGTRTNLEGTRTNLEGTRTNLEGTRTNREGTAEQTQAIVWKKSPNEDYYIAHETKTNPLKGITDKLDKKAKMEEDTDDSSVFDTPLDLIDDKIEEDQQDAIDEVESAYDWLIRHPYTADGILESTTQRVLQILKESRARLQQTEMDEAYEVVLEKEEETEIGFKSTKPKNKLIV